MGDPALPSGLPDFVSAWPCRPGGCSPRRHKGLAPRGAYALWTTAVILADEWREALAGVPHDGRPGNHPAFGDLPPIARRVGSAPWLERFIRCFDDLGAAIAAGDTELTCTGEEVAFQMILTNCRELLADEFAVPPGFEDWPGHGDSFDFDLSRAETVICQDIDVCWLWQPDLDGIEEDASLEASLLRPVNLHPKDWFKPFEDVRRLPSPGPELSGLQ